MKWKSVIFLSAILLLFSISLVTRVQANPAFHEITLSLAAGSARIPAGTPIILKISDIQAKLNGANIDWKSIYLFSGSAPINSFAIVPYQIDDIDGIPGVSANDEFVFQSVSEIAPGGSATYTLWFAEVADNFQSFSWPTNAWIDSAQNYSNTDLGALGGPYRAEYGLGRLTYFLKNDMATISIPMQADYRTGAVFNAVVNATTWDAVKQGSYLTPRDEYGFRWSGYLYETNDGGWDRGPLQCNYTLVNAVWQGPVRSMLVINTTATYSFGSTIIPGAYELKTFMVYKGMPAVYSNIALTGSNATMNYNFTHQVKMDEEASTGGTFDTVYAPGVGKLPRYNYATHLSIPGLLYDVSLGMTNMTKSWYTMYNATSQQGYGLIFSNASLLKIDWSGGELDLKYNTIPPQGAQRLFVMFDKSVTSNSTTLMNNMYDTWKATPTVTLTTATVETESPDLNVVALQNQIAASGLQGDMLQSKIARLGLSLDMLTSTQSALQGQLSNQSLALDNLNITLTSQISTLKSSITSLQSSITTLTSTVTALNTTLTTSTSDLQDKINSANSNASTAMTIGAVGVVVGVIGIIVGAVAYMRKK